MNKKAFIFDLYGVIVDTAKYHFTAWKKLANSIGVDFTEEQNEQLKGVSRVQSLEKILDWADIELTKDRFMELIARKNGDYLRYINEMDASEILPGVPEILDYLITCHQPIALGSASKNARMILQKVQRYNSFDAVVDGTDVSKAKPDPEVFLKAADLLKAKPEECVVFEDSIAGIQAANIANMIAVGIGEKKIMHKADFVFKKFTEITPGSIDELILKEVKVTTQLK